MKNAIGDVLTITKRQLLQLARVPELLVFSTIQPVMFVLLFRYVFGGSIDSGQPGGYVQLLHFGFNCDGVSWICSRLASNLRNCSNNFGFCIPFCLWIRLIVDRYFGRPIGKRGANRTKCWIPGDLPADIFI